MPLSCDCYPGCWGVHSQDWPEIWEPRTMSQGEFYRLVHKLVPYGSYVMMHGRVRVETADLHALVELHLVS